MMRRIAMFALLLPCIMIGTASAGLDEGRNALQKGDYATALIELKPLADKGNPEAQFLLGTMYASGHGVPKDDKQTAEWYRKAAVQGFALGQTNLGYMYRDGQGVPQD